jgi:hypothetical protein
VTAEFVNAVMRRLGARLCESEKRNFDAAPQYALEDVREAAEEATGEFPLSAESEAGILAVWAAMGRIDENRKRLGMRTYRKE